jgi:membrane-bound lytic murein transglycosylase D
MKYPLHFEGLMFWNGRKLFNTGCSFFTLLAFVTASCSTLPTPAPITVPTTLTKPAEDPVAQVEAEAQALEAGQEAVEVAETTEENADEADELSPSEIEKASLLDVIKFEEPNTHTLYDDSRYDFPITMNSRVEGWIDYFTGRGRHHMERYLARSSRYIPMMKEILRKEGLPEDLVYLALIESGFNLRARSHARAVGPWQFMKATGTRYGLRVDAWIDERHDPVLSTAAAASYLKDLYLMFESWYLAAAAYNAGEYKILRAIKSAQSNNFWRLAETRYIRRETKDYVPKLIAASIIAKNAEKYGFGDIVYEQPLDFETVVVDFPVPLSRLADLLDTSAEDIENLNPQLRRGIVPPGTESYELRVPVGSRVVVQRAVAAMRASLTNPEMPTQYQVRAGDTLNSVSRKYGLRSNDLAYVNNLSRRERLVPGSSLIIPKQERRAANARTVPAVDQSGGGTAKTHKVRRGESLWSIAEKYNVTIQDIFSWNGMSDSHILPGRVLVVHPDAGKKIVRERVPQGQTDASGYLVHVVQRGETLWGIAARYNTNINSLKKINRLGRNRIYPGKRLRVKAELGDRA